MTYGGFAVEPDVLRAVAPKFDVAGDALKTALDTLFAAGQAEGAPWGGDDIGQAFAQGYLPAVADAREGFTAVSESMYSLGDSLRIAADRWEQREKQNTEQLGGH